MSGLPSKILQFPNGMTVAELKEIIKDWPEKDGQGDPCEVWVCDAIGLSNQVVSVSALNYRKEAGLVWSDILLETR